MTNDIRYRAVKTGCETGDIQTFSAIFEILPRTVVARNMKWSYQSLSSRIKHPDRADVRDILRLSDHFAVDPVMIFQLLRAEKFRRNKKS